VALGADATSRDGLSLWWQRPVVLLSALTLLTTLVLTALASRRPPEPVRPLPRPGSTEVVAFLPLGQVRRVSEFRWASPVDASRYIVVVRHAGSTAEVLRRETSEQALTIDKELAARFRPGDYNWTVQAVGSNGSIVAQSNVETFLLR
jgi:hypothetical protein